MQRRTFIASSLGALALGTLPTHTFAQAASPTPTATPVLFGTAHDLVPEGEPNTVGVVLTGAPIGADVPFVLRNTTSDAVMIDTVGAIARDAAGTLFSSAEDFGLTPFTIPPQGIAIGFVSFPYGTVLPFDATFEFTIDPIKPGERLMVVDIPVVEAALTPTGLVGRAENGTDTVLSSPHYTVIWFDPATGQITGGWMGYANEDEVDAGGFATFNSDFGGSYMTEVFLVGVIGMDYSF